jgi:hypothetical protein
VRLLVELLFVYCRRSTHKIFKIPSTAVGGFLLTTYKVTPET